MSADFRKINLAMQSDPDFRLLPPPAQHLYYVLWCHPELSYCGVVDWRPGRLGALAHGWGREAVEESAACLESRHFIVTDAETEECLIRSWVRFDGLLKQPRMAVSFANAFHATASNTIRGVIVHEATKLKEREPDLSGWGKDQVREVLTFPSVDPKVRATPKDPFGDGFGDGFTPSLAQIDPKVSPSVSVSPTTATATATSRPTTKTQAPRKRATRIPDDFQVTDEMREWVTSKGWNHLDLDEITEEFFDYWSALSGSKAVKLDWVKTWRNRIRDVADRAPRRSNVAKIEPRKGMPPEPCSTCGAPPEHGHYDGCPVAS